MSDPASTPHAPPPEARLTQALFGFMVTKSLSVVASLGVADLLTGGPRYYVDLAEEAGVDRRALHRVLRLLASLGIFAEPKPGTFALTDVSELLRSDHPRSMRDAAVMIGADAHWESWRRFGDVVRSGESGPRHAFGTDIFSWFQASENAEQWAIFNRAMTAFSATSAAHVVESYDFSGCRTIVDIGGGHGLLLRRVLAVAPDARGVLFDMPRVVAGAPDLERVEAVGGDFFDSVPGGADTYMLKNIIHDWSDDQAVTILRNIADAMDAAGRVLVLESVMPETNEPHPAKFMDVNMLAMTEGGCERTRAEFEALFAEAGLRLLAIHATKGEVSVIEAIPNPERFFGTPS